MVGISPLDPLGPSDIPSRGSLDLAALGQGDLHRYRYVAKIASAAAIVVGAVALLGWILEIPRLADFTFDDITMKANTALGMVLLGVSLWLLLPQSASRARRFVGAIATLLVLALGVLTLSEHIVGWNLGIDQLIAGEPIGETATMSPQRMGPPAAISFTLLGAGLLCINIRTRRGGSPSQIAALVVASVALLNLIGNLYGARALFAVAAYTGISRQASFAFLMLSLAVLCARPDTGVMRVATSAQPGGLMFRRVLLSTIVATVLIGYACGRLQLAGAFDMPFGVALMTVALIVIVTMVVWWNSRALNRLAEERLAAEAADRESRERLLEGERHARRSIERMARLKDEFLATLSHELRTPLNAILGWTHLLRDHCQDPQRIRDAVDVIDRNARAQAQLVADLLDMSRIISGKMRLHLQPVDLHAVIGAAIETVTPAADARGVRIHQVVDAIPGTLIGDAARLQQVLWNLLSNAVKFTPRGGQATVRVAPCDAGVEISVSDTGKGIPADFLPYVFDRFRQGDATSSREHRGLGLGLAIVKQLVDLHGGRVRVESEGEGRGSIFTLQLPIAADVDPPHDKSLTLRAEVTSTRFDEQASLQGLTICLVDDDDDSREVARRILEEGGAEVVEACTTDDAISTFANRRFDVLIGDIGLPGRDGYELIRELRSTGHTTPAVALTAFARHEDCVRALNAGYQAHLCKPVDPAILISTIVQLVAAGRAATPSRPRRAIRVLCIDDNEDLCNALAMAIGREPGLDVCGTLYTADAMLTAIPISKPDVVLLDLTMPGRDPLAVVREVAKRHPEVRVVIMSGHDDDDSVARARQAGACGFLPKHGDVVRMIDAIRTVASGWPWFRQRQNDAAPTQSFQPTSH